MTAFKSCATCQVIYQNRAAWDALPLVGLTDCGDGLFLVMRNCPCKSTLATQLTIGEHWLELSGILQEMLQANAAAVEQARHDVTVARMRLSMAERA